VTEIANTSLADGKGEKRLLYEALGVGEYWVVDVANVQILAFAIADGGSKRITESQVLPNLPLSLLEEALRRTREIPQSEVIRKARSTSIFRLSGRLHKNLLQGIGTALAHV